MAILDQIYEAVSDDEAFEALPAAIAGLVGARSCVLMEFDRNLILKTAAVSYVSREMLDFQKDPEIARLDLWTAHGAQPHLIGQMNNGDEVWDLPTFMRTPYYNECIRKFGDDTVHCLGGVTRGAEGYLTVAVHNGIGAKPFESADTAKISAHVAHIFRMLDLRARLKSSQASGDLLQQALDQVAGGVLALDGALRVKAANARASAMLAASDGLRLAGGRVSTVDARLQARFAHAVRSAATWTNGRGDSLRLNRSDARPAFRVLVSPMPGSQPVALVVIEDPQERDPGLAASLTRMYGLTASEAELAALLAEGLTPGEAAEARDVRLSTVRSQIKSLLGKTEASRLSDLIRLLSRMPRRAGSP